MELKNRWLVWTGPAFTVLFVIASMALEGNTPGEKASADEVMKYYNAHQGRTTASVFLAPLGAALLVLFASYVRTLVRDREPAVGAGPTVLVAGAVLWASGLLVGSSLTLALLTASDHGQAQVAETMNVLSNDMWLPFVAGIAVTLLGAGMTVLASGILPRWMGWVALVIGVISLAGPGGFLGFFVAPLWILVAGIMLARAPRSTVAAV
jgi:MFS family permease